MTTSKPARPFTPVTYAALPESFKRKKIVVGIDRGYSQVKVVVYEVDIESKESREVARFKFPSYVATAPTGKTVPNDWKIVEVEGARLVVGPTAAQARGFADRLDTRFDLVQSVEFLATVKFALDELKIGHIDYLVFAVADAMLSSTPKIKGRVRELCNLPASTDITFLPQALSGLSHYVLALEPGLSLLYTDIGYLTVLARLFDGQQISHLRSSASDKGVNALVDTLSKASLSNLMLADREAQRIQELLLKGNTSASRTSVTRIRESGWAEDIWRQVGSRLRSQDDIDVVVLTGGGSYLLRESAAAYFSNSKLIVPDSPEFSAVQAVCAWTIRKM
jgi:hypothetical protein